MTPIIAGRVDQDEQAQQAVEALRRQGFAEDDVTTFYVNPPGQHGDRDPSPGSTHVHSGAIKGAAVGAAVGLGVGLIAAPVMGPAAAVVAASAGAYAGALEETEDKPTRGEVDPVVDDDAAPRVVEAVKPVRNAGLLIAVRAPDYAKRVEAVNVLRAAGARDIERADGTWEKGAWVDFNPLKPPRLVDLPGPEPYAVRG